MVKRPVDQTQQGTHMEWEFMCRIGMAGEDVIGKEMGSSPGISHSPPMTVLNNIDIFYGGWLSSAPFSWY